MAKDEGARLGTNQSVERAIAVLKAFADRGRALRVGEVALLCGLGTSTTSRLLATLVAEGMIERSDSGSYQLGPEVITLAGVALNHSQLAREARQVAYEVASTTSLGANVAERRDNRVFYLVHFDGAMAPRAYTLLGRRSPLHATGLGKALISELPPEEHARLLGKPPWDAYTPHTATQPDQMERELAVIRQRGYATEREELAFGRGCVSAPIRGRDGRVVAAISVSGPLSALRLEARERELARTVIEAADRIGAAIGASPQIRSSPPDIPALDGHRRSV